MPCIQLYTSRDLPAGRQAALKESFGKAIESIPGKTEKWLMCIFHPGYDMWFQGEQKDTAFLEASIYGQPEGESIDRLTKELTRIIHEELGVDPENVYVKYSMTPYWGWNGKNFGR